MKAITSKDAAVAVATTTTTNNDSNNVENATMKNSTNEVRNAINPTATAPVTAYDMSRVISTMMTMQSTVLTDYLTMFYADTAQAVVDGSLNPLIKLILDKGFARHWTEHNSTHSRIEDEAMKLASIREVIKYWNINVLTKSAYEAATRPAPEPKAPKAPRVAGNGTLKVLADRITAMSLSVEVELTDRAAYAKIANALSLTNGRAMYDTLMTLPKAAAIITAAETAIEADKEAAVAEAQRLADIEAQAMAAELADMFG